MERFILERFEIFKDAVLGKIIDNQEKIICYTLEQPWQNNKTDISCVPPGIYKCHSFSGKYFQNVWILLDVPDREGILIHNGNYAINTKGCILVGNIHTLYKGTPMVNNSVNTLNKMREMMPKEFELEIKYVL